jgi:hypothetical protein
MDFIDVHIICEEKAYQMIKECIEKHNKQNNDDFKPDCFEQKENYFVLSWYSIKWNPALNEIQSIENVLQGLPFDEEGYGFRKIEVSPYKEIIETWNSESIEPDVERRING